MTNKLYRSRSNRVFGGVASGLATYLNIDPILARVIFVISTLFNGIGLIAYIILWIVIPEEPVTASSFNFGAGNPNPNPQGDGEKNLHKV